MHNEATLSAILENAGMFAADQLTRLDSSKTKTLRLPSKFAYFQGGSAYHRVAVVCPLNKGISEDQQLLAGLIWANKVSNGQKTLLYIVRERFGSQISYMGRMFGPRVEIRLAYYTPKLTSPFHIAGRETGTAPLRYQVVLPKDRAFWEHKFNPVEQGWLRMALEYFEGFEQQGVRISCLENWISVKFKGLEMVRISRKDTRLRVALITRYPREIPGSVGCREEVEGWFNAQGVLNSEFELAFAKRMTQLGEDRELFCRVCPDQHHLEYLLTAQPDKIALLEPIYSQLNISCKGETPVTLDFLGINREGNLQMVVVHPNKDLLGFARVLALLAWAENQFAVLKSAYFNGSFMLDPVAWLVCPENRVHPDLEILQSLMRTQTKIRLMALNNDWLENGITNLKSLG